LPCGELLMQVFLARNRVVPRIFLHKAIGIVFPSARAALCFTMKSFTLQVLQFLG
jgi:hypothetical protein